MPADGADAVVIGAGPNGLIGANALADAGWSVLLLEAAGETGGAVRTAEVTAPGFRTDLFSAFYPLAAASPVIRGLDLADHGLAWVHAPEVLAHALDDGRAAVLSTSVERTAASVDEFAPGDGAAWVELASGWQAIRDPLLDALFSPFPPVRAAARLLRRTGVAGGLDLARLAVLPVRRLAEERFRGAGAALLLAGNAMHTDVPPDAAGSGIVGWLLAMLGQDVGFPVPRGGAQSLARALESRLVSRGGEVRTGHRVTGIEVVGGRAVAVRVADGSVVRARRAVLADVPAPALYRDLVGLEHLPAALGRHLDRFQWDPATIKVNWALDRRVPWRAAGVTGAGTVHLGADSDGLVDFAADLSTGRVPQRPFLVFGQMTTADPTRSPAGTESAWAYTHVPRNRDWDAAAVAEHVARMRGGGRAGGARLRSQRAGPARPVAGRPGSDRPEPGRRGDQRRHGVAAPAALPAPHPRVGPAGDAGGRPLPGRRLGASRRRRARRLRLERRPVRAACRRPHRTGAPAAQPRGVGPAAAAGLSRAATACRA